MPDEAQPIENRLDIAWASQISNGDQLRNINSYEYLRNIADAVFFDSFEIPADAAFDSFRLLKQFQSENPEYNPTKPYGNLYTDFFLLLEKNVNAMLCAEKEAILFEKIRILLHSIFVNWTQALLRSTAMVQRILDDKRYSFEDIKEKITARLSNGVAINNITPESADTAYFKAWGIVPVVMANMFKEKMWPWAANAMCTTVSYYKPYFKPMFITSIPSIRVYQYQQRRDAIELRMGTQGQYDSIVARVNPIFTAWLQTLPPTQKRIQFVYFNNLGLDRFGHEGGFEKGMTDALHKLEETHRNIAVITFPADQGLMNVKLIKNNNKNISQQDAFKKMLDIVMERSDEKIKDFKMSDEIKSMLYTDKNQQEDKLKELLCISFQKILNTMSPELSADMISPAQMQAVYFHFMKYEYKKFIIETLNPDFITDACKDAIDRAGAESAYYNLIKSIEMGKPLSKEEFECALYGAPTMVKGRGMNHHIEILWNAISHYIDGNEKQIAEEKKEIPSWLLEWRNQYAPHFSKCYFVQQLKKYVPDADAQGRVQYGPFFREELQEKERKIVVANKVARYLENNFQGGLTDAEWTLLHQSELSTICREIEATLDLSAIKPVESPVGLCAS